MNSLSFLLLEFPNLIKFLFGKCSNAPFNVEVNGRGGGYMLKLSVEELVEINDFYNGSTKVTITHATGNTVLLELYDGGDVEEFILSKRDLIMVLRNFYVEDICDIVHAAVYGSVDVKVDRSSEQYPVQISVEDGHKYYCNLEELSYIQGIINYQRNAK